jgi:hypothetical protein
LGKGDGSVATFSYNSAVGTPAPEGTAPDGSEPGGSAAGGGGGAATDDGATITATPDGKPPVVNVDGSKTLPGGGELSLSNNRATITAPPGTVVNTDGSISIPKGSGGGTVIHKGGFTFNIPEGATVIFDADVPLGYRIEVDNPFTDVKDSDWFFGSVMFAFSHALMKGNAEDMFSPGDPVTRGMLVTVFHRLSGSPDAGGLSNPFGDVEAGQWYADAVAWASANGIVNGYGSAADSDSSIVDGYGATADNDSGIANGYGAVADNGRMFGSGDNITRQDLAVILKRYLAFMEVDTHETEQNSIFADESDISGYALDAIRTLNGLGIINGNGANEDGHTVIDPKNQATRAQAAAMIERLIYIAMA